MNDRKRIILMIWLMTGISLMITGVTIASLYRTAVKEEKKRLVETVQSQARIIEAMAKFDADNNSSYSPGGSRGATLTQINTAHNNYEQGGMTMEVTLAERNGNWISFLIRHRHGGLEDYLKPISFDSNLAVPMREALLGNSGTIIAEDYRGEMVLAAYEPVREMNLGIVAKIDLSEIRAPFIKAGLTATLFAVLIVGIGATLFFRIGNPLIDTIAEQNAELLRSNERLQKEIEERVEAQSALKKAHDELEVTVASRTKALSASNVQLKKEIRDRQEAEHELKKNEAMLTKIFDGILDPLILLDRNMMVMMMNQAAIDYYGIENPKDILGKACHLELMARPEACPECRVVRAVDSGRHVAFERKGLLDPERVENVVAYPLMGSDGAVTSVIVHINDITDKRRLERQLIQKEKLSSLGVMVSSVAHEINNPNNFISFNIPILREYIAEMLPIIAAHAHDTPGFEVCNLSYDDFEEDLIKLLDNIENGSKRISSFISNLREYSHDKSESSRITVDLGYTIDSVLSICHSKISRSVKKFIKTIPENLPQLWAQPYSIEQILINFLINACDAVAQDDSWICLEVDADGDRRKEVRIDVSDNGQGIDDKTLTKIFDPFFSTKSPEGGTGLGLFVSHNLAQRMGGRIEVASHPGEGSRFSLILPVREPGRIDKEDGKTVHDSQSA